MQFALILTDTQVWTRPMEGLSGVTSGPAEIDINRDKGLSVALDAEAAREGGSTKRESKRAHETQSTGLDPSENPRFRKNYSPAEISTAIEIATYTFGTAAALAVFLRNVVGTIKDWQDLGARARHGRQISLKIGSRTIEVNDGDDLEEVIKGQTDKQQ